MNPIFLKQNQLLTAPTQKCRAGSNTNSCVSNCHRRVDANCFSQWLGDTKKERNLENEQH